jgi:fructokinase
MSYGFALSWRGGSQRSVNDYVVIVGENVADALIEPMRTGDGRARFEIFSGGGPANTAVALSRLGTHTKFISRIADGILGNLFIERLESSGVDLSLSITAKESATLAIASVGPDGSAMYDFYAEGTADWQWEQGELIASSLRNAACVHTGSLGLVMAPGSAVVESFLEEARKSSTISIDPNVRTALVDTETYRRKIHDWTRLADIFRLSEDDLNALFPNTPYSQLFDEWHSAGVSLVILTRGSRSTLASFEGARLEVPTPVVQISDTIGAGDAFTAGLLHWLFHNEFTGGRLVGLGEDHARRALAFAGYIAALSCTSPGANPPWKDQLTTEAVARFL